MVDTMTSTKGLSRLLYEMGRTFDGLSATRTAVERFLRDNDPTAPGSRDDLALLEDLRDASTFTLHYDYGSAPFDLSYVKAINARLKRTAAIEPGELRASENVFVNCTRGRVYVPPVPDADALEDVVRRARESEGALADAAGLFAGLAKAQPFGDGNKRTALLAANGLLLRSNQPCMLSVPVEPGDTETFNRLLSDWYLDGDETVIGWLTDWNSTVADSIPRPDSDPAPAELPDPDPSATAGPGNTLNGTSLSFDGN